MKKFLALLAMASSFLAVSCNKNNDEDDDDQKQEEAQGLGIKIDGNFDDWAALKPGVVASAKNDANSPWEAVKEIRCCADKDFVYYYIKYGKSDLDDLLSEAAEELPIRLCIDTNDDFSTGYTSYFLDAYDFIVEGGLASNGSFTAYDGNFYQRVDDKWNLLLAEGSNMVLGAGSGNEYEILLARELFNNAVSSDQKIGDVFYTGIRFYTDGAGTWAELSNMPNASVEEGDGNGWGHLLKVTTSK